MPTAYLNGVAPSVYALVARQTGALAYEVREAVGGTQGTPTLSTNDDQLELQIARPGRMAMRRRHSAPKSLRRLKANPAP